MLFTRAEPPEEQSSGSQHPRCVFLQRNLAPGQTARRRGINISGVDFWHAVEFSRNRHFHRTHPRHSLEAFLRALPFGDSDFIRGSESAFPPGPGVVSRGTAPGSRSGGTVNVLERGAPMQIEG